MTKCSLLGLLGPPLGRDVLLREHVPASFDPFATHPFTNNSGVPPQPPQPYPYPRPIPSGQLSHGHPAAYTPPAPSSLPTAKTPAPLHAPQPHRGPQPGSRQHVFEPFRVDRSSPDLKDVLAKKNISPQGRPQKTK